MNTIELTTTEFRRNQKHFLELATQGFSVLIHKGKDLFVLNHVPTEYNFDEQTRKVMESAREQYRSGKTTRVHNREELHQLLNDL